MGLHKSFDHYVQAYQTETHSVLWSGNNEVLKTFNTKLKHKNSKALTLTFR